MLALQLILLFIPLPISTKLIIRISITIRVQTSCQINLKRFSHTQTNHATHFDVSFFFMKLFWHQKGKAREAKRNEIKTNVERCQIYFHLCVSYIFATHSSNIWQFYLCENARGNSGQVILSIASIAVQCCGHSSGPLSGGPPFATTMTTTTTSTMGSPKSKFMRLPCRKCVFSKCFKLYNENLWRTAGSLREKVKIAC